MKTYTIYELFKAIKEDEIEKGQRVSDDNGNIYIVTDTVDLLEDIYGNPILELFANLEELFWTEFKLTSDEENIDIQDMEELPKVIAISDKGYIGQSSFIELCNKVNILIQAVKQLERENKTLKQTSKSYKGIINKQNKENKKLIEKLEEKIRLINSGETLSIRSILKEILEILKGEKNE